MPLPERPAIPPVMACGDLASRDFLGIAGAPTRISSAQVQTRDGGQEFCLVKGMIAPQIQFELHLPTRSYTGRYLQGGCGGACGVIYDHVLPSCDNRHLAVLLRSASTIPATSAPNRSTRCGRPMRRNCEDFAYRAAHVVALASKQILSVYYGRPPQYSYFLGCSNGGREAMMEAQRFPDDFDGIVAGAPALWITAGVVRIIHESQVSQDAAGKPVLTPQATSLLHDAVIAACDGLDGLKDGQIDNPRACRFDPGQLVCKPGVTSGCISPQQADVIRKLYRGPVDRAGRTLFFGANPMVRNCCGPGRAVSSSTVTPSRQIRSSS
jgi:feruloyl esterase